MPIYTVRRWSPQGYCWTITCTKSLAYAKRVGWGFIKYDEGFVEIFQDDDVILFRQRYHRRWQSTLKGGTRDGKIMPWS